MIKDVTFTSTFPKHSFSRDIRIPMLQIDWFIWMAWPLVLRTLYPLVMSPFLTSLSYHSWKTTCPMFTWFYAISLLWGLLQINRLRSFAAHVMFKYIRVNIQPSHCVETFHSHSHQTPFFNFHQRRPAQSCLWKIFLLPLLDLFFVLLCHMLSLEHFLVYSGTELS